MAEKPKRTKQRFKDSTSNMADTTELTRLEESLKTNRDNAFQCCLDKLLRMSGMLLDHLDFMAELKELGLYHCMVTVAVQADRMDELDLKEIYDQDLSDAFWDHIFSYMVSQKSWLQILELSKCLDDHKILVKWILTMAEVDDAALLQVIFEDPRSTHYLDVWVLSAIFFGHIQSFEFLLNSDNSSVQRTVSQTALLWEHGCFLVQFVASTCRTRHGMTFQPSCPWYWSNFKNTDYDRCVHLMCKVGLFACYGLSDDDTNQTPLGMAVLYNQPDLVRLLYQAGVCANNAEIFRLSRDPKLKERCKAERGKEQPSASSANKFPAADDVDAAMEIRDFLSSMASRPRSLQDLCLQEVAKRLGWGQERDRRVEQLDITKALKERLTFSKGMRLLTAEES